MLEVMNAAMNCTFSISPRSFCEHCHHLYYVIVHKFHHQRRNATQMNERLRLSNKIQPFSPCRAPWHNVHIDDDNISTATECRWQSEWSGACSTNLFVIELAKGEREWMYFIKQFSQSPEQWHSDGTNDKDPTRQKQSIYLRETLPMFMPLVEKCHIFSSHSSTVDRLSTQNILKVFKRWPPPNQYVYNYKYTNLIDMNQAFSSPSPPNRDVKKPKEKNAPPRNCHQIIMCERIETHASITISLSDALNIARQPNGRRIVCTRRSENQTKVIIDIHHLPIERNGSDTQSSTSCVNVTTTPNEHRITWSLRCNLVNEHKI